jgi:hypothetical protein
MKTDRELLELAARAAGIDARWSAPSKSMELSYQNSSMEMVGRGWNPLSDDGDALRLAVKCGIEPKKPSRARSVGVVVQAWYPPDGNPNRSACAHVSEHVMNGDRLEATRRAIVRAAAEIQLQKEREQ